MDEKTPTLELLEPVSPEDLVPAYDFLPLWLLLAAVVFLVFLAWFLSRRRKSVADLAALRREAYQRAKKALDTLTGPNAREAAVSSSLILRRFLADTVNDPSLFETHEEFISRQDSLKKLTPPARDAAAAAFTRLARLKYAPEIPSDDPASVVREARELLETLNGGFQP